MIICTIGKLKSGKSKLADILHDATEYPMIEVSRLVKWFAHSGVRKDLQLEREKHKDNPNWLYDEVKGLIAINTIVSGIREKYLLDQLRKDFGDQEIVVIAAEISDKERQRRAAAIDKKTEQEFLEDDERDKQFDIDELIANADYKINTERPLPETEVTLLKLLIRLLR